MPQKYLFSLLGPLFVGEYRPNEANPLSGNGNCDNIVGFVVGNLEFQVAPIQALLGFVGYGYHLRWLPLPALSQAITDGGPVAVVPRSLHQDTPHILVSVLGDSPSLLLSAT